MKKILLGIVLGALALSAWQRVNHPESMTETANVEQPASLTVETITSPPSFHCDGRTRCTEMTSCEEATFFLQNCPGVKMDGGGDGVPCERQWCGHR